VLWVDPVPEVESDRVEGEDIVEGRILEEKYVSLLGGRDDNGRRRRWCRRFLHCHDPDAGAQSQAGPLHLLERGTHEDAGVLNVRPTIVDVLVFLVLFVSFRRQNLGVFNCLYH